MENEILLGNESRSTFLEKCIEAELEKGWSSFIKGIIDSNKKSNKRLFKVLEKRQGKQFVKDAKLVHKTVGGTCRIEIVREVTGL